MTDDELQARLRRLAAAPDKDARFWDEMADEVRAAWARTLAEEARRRRWRRWRVAPLGAGLALAAALAVYVRAPRHAPPPAPAPAEAPLGADEVDVFGDVGPDELIDELTPAELDRVAQAFKKGA